MDREDNTLCCNEAPEPKRTILRKIVIGGGVVLGLALVGAFAYLRQEDEFGNCRCPFKPNNPIDADASEDEE